MDRRAVAFGLASLFTVNTIAPVCAAERRLPDGARVSVRLMEQISSATMKDHDPVNFAVIEDVVVDGEVVIKQGTPVRGVVVEAESKRRMGRAGKMYYTVNETKATDQTVIRLRAVQDKKGDSHVTSTAVTTGTVAVFVPVAAPFFLLRKGKDVVVPEGTRVEAFVDGDHVISTEPPVKRGEAPSANRKRGEVITNSDVVALHKAGFGDDVVLAKINASTAAFDVDASNLVALKKAGISEKVIAAMVAAN
jgi:hypothetical protein